MELAMPFFSRKNLWVILAADILVLVLCYVGAYLIRFGGYLFPEYQYQMLTTLAPMVSFKICCCFAFDLNRGMWRYTGIRDLINIMKGSVSGALLFIMYLAMFHHFQGISRSVLIIDLLLTVMSIGGLRLMIRLYYQGQRLCRGTRVLA
jgi:FlaA1/EpsC-like NDP-sugar epimerase